MQMEDDGHRTSLMKPKSTTHHGVTDGEGNARVKYSKLEKKARYSVPFSSSVKLDGVAHCGLETLPRGLAPRSAIRHGKDGSKQCRTMSDNVDQRAKLYHDNEKDGNV